MGEADVDRTLPRRCGLGRGTDVGVVAAGGDLAQGNPVAVEGGIPCDQRKCSQPADVGQLRGIEQRFGPLLVPHHQGGAAVHQRDVPVHRRHVLRRLGDVDPKRNGSPEGGRTRRGHQACGCDGGQGRGGGEAAASDGSHGYRFARPSCALEVPARPWTFVSLRGGLDGRRRRVGASRTRPLPVLLDAHRPSGVLAWRSRSPDWRPRSRCSSWQSPTRCSRSLPNSCRRPATGRRRRGGKLALLVPGCSPRPVQPGVPGPRSGPGTGAPISVDGGAGPAPGAHTRDLHRVAPGRLLAHAARDLGTARRPARARRARSDDDPLCGPGRTQYGVAAEASAVDPVGKWARGSCWWPRVPSA